MSTLHVIDKWDAGFGWMVDPTERLQRASHAVRGRDGLWLIDPVDSAKLSTLLQQDDTVAGIVVALDRHTRDADQLARKYSVPVSRSTHLTHIDSTLSSQTMSLDSFHSATSWKSMVVLDRRGWTEIALISADNTVAYIPESIGTAPYFLGPGDRLGLHPLLRILPPRESLLAVSADRLLFGHGAGIDAGGHAAINDTLRHARRRAPGAFVTALKTFATPW